MCVGRREEAQGQRSPMARRMDRGQEKQGWMDLESEALVRQEGTPNPGGAKPWQAGGLCPGSGQGDPQAPRPSPAPPSFQDRRRGHQQGTQEGPAGRALAQEVGGGLGVGGKPRDQRGEAKGRPRSREGSPLRCPLCSASLSALPRAASNAAVSQQGRTWGGKPSILPVWRLLESVSATTVLNPLAFHLKTKMHFCLTLGKHPFCRWGD